MTLTDTAIPVDQCTTQVLSQRLLFSTDDNNTVRDPQKGSYKRMSLSRPSSQGLGIYADEKVERL